jgi:hypothetical protein
LTKHRGMSREERLSKQREYQRKYRAARKKAEVPDRDDIARMALHWMITEALKGRNKKGMLEKVQTEIVQRLVEQGFDPKASDDAFDALVERYSAGWSFQRKLHLSEGKNAPEELA